MRKKRKRKILFSILKIYGRFKFLLDPKEAVITEEKLKILMVAHCPKTECFLFEMSLSWALSSSYQGVQIARCKALQASPLHLAYALTHINSDFRNKSGIIAMSHQQPACDSVIREDCGWFTHKTKTFLRQIIEYKLKCKLLQKLKKGRNGREGQKYD